MANIENQILSTLAPDDCIFNNRFGRFLLRPFGIEVITNIKNSEGVGGNAICNILTIACRHDGRCPLSYRGSEFHVNNQSK